MKDNIKLLNLLIGKKIKRIAGDSDSIDINFEPEIETEYFKKWINETKTVSKYNLGIYCPWRVMKDNICLFGSCDCSNSKCDKLENGLDSEDVDTVLSDKLEWFQDSYIESGLYISNVTFNKKGDVSLELNNVFSIELLKCSATADRTEWVFTEYNRISARVLVQNANNLELDERFWVSL